MKTAARSVMWVGKATVFLVGLAMILALTVGLASAALAGTGIGASLNLGKVNTVNAISTLVGSVAGSSLRIDNNSTGTGATALRLEVEPGKPPMSVNSTTEVQGLNVDSLDGMNSGAFLQESTDRDDFFSGKTYTATGNGVTLAAGQSAFATARCDSGDAALSGGYNFGFGNHSSVFSVGASGEAYNVGFRGPTSVVPSVTCADFPPLRT
jgi:hypothetical protein